MEYKELTHKIIGCAYAVFNQLGFGFLERVYQKAMVIELGRADLKVEEENPITVYYDEYVVGKFSADLYVEEIVVVELKSVQNMVKDHEI
jgi:GxxExxY protein